MLNRCAVDSLSQFLLWYQNFCVCFSQESPVHCMRSLDALMSLAKKKGRREALVAVGMNLLLNMNSVTVVIK